MSREPLQVQSGMVAAQVALSGVAAVLLAAAVADATYKNITRRFVAIKNNDAAINVYIGPDNTVTAATGYLLKPGNELILSADGLVYTGVLYAIAASGTPSVSVLTY